MRTIFPEWYGPNPEELSTLLKEATIAFDANTLLDLYRVSDIQRVEIISVLKLVQDRIFVPYQVALEYQRGRLGEVSAQQKAHEALASGVEKELGGLLADLDSKAEAVGVLISKLRDKDIKSELSNQLELAVRTISDQVEESKKLLLLEFAGIKSGHIVEFGEAREADPVRDELDSILTGDRVGSRADDAELKKRVAEGIRRVKEEIPPGYKDSGKKDPTGDYLAWRELLEFAKGSSRNVLLVTNDEKEDWYQSAHGQKIGPRPELKKEMASEAGKYYHQTSLFGFLNLAKEHLNASLSDATIESVSSVRVNAHFQDIEMFEGRVLDIRVTIQANGKLNFLVLVEVNDLVRVISIENISEIERIGILLGDMVVGGKTNTGFEFIAGPIADVRTGREREFVAPSHCPECGTLLALRDDETRALKCLNSEHCPAQNR